jgi:hypothetical protein
MITNVSILTDPAYFVLPSCHCGILALSEYNFEATSQNGEIREKNVNMKSDRKICNATNYPHDSALTKRFVVKITVERCD